MMKRIIKKSQKEIVKLTAHQALLKLFYLGLPFFEASRIYRFSARKIHEQINTEDYNLSDKIYYLKRYGYIDDFVEGKDNYIEITPKGMRKVDQIRLENLSNSRPDRWDKKWRLVIFDIADKRKMSRDIFRRKLIKAGFQKIQESVYVYPFECTPEITVLAKNLGLDDEVIIMISDIIQGEESIIKKFIDNGILTKFDLKN